MKTVIVLFTMLLSSAFACKANFDCQVQQKFGNLTSGESSLAEVANPQPQATAML
ncbi:hypothetical protein LN893_10740 [Pontibacter sp. XAAS-A31]|nr:hypothetical protein [Pontibacter harenae]